MRPNPTGTILRPAESQSAQRAGRLPHERNAINRKNDGTQIAHNHNDRPRVRATEVAGSSDTGWPDRP